MLADFSKIVVEYSLCGNQYKMRTEGGDGVVLMVLLIKKKNTFFFSYQGSVRENNTEVMVNTKLALSI